ncbi:PPC domain-containing protein [Psidium guajava]|nr:PPC domain-containing protein [Psidium guajava]
MPEPIRHVSVENNPGSSLLHAPSDPPMLPSPPFAATTRTLTDSTHSLSLSHTLRSPFQEEIRELIFRLVFMVVLVGVLKSDGAQPHLVIPKESEASGLILHQLMIFIYRNFLPFVIGDTMLLKVISVNCALWDLIWSKMVALSMDLRASKISIRAGDRVHNLKFFYFFYFFCVCGPEEILSLS